MIELTEHQRQELAAPQPTAIDPTTKEQYVLVPKAKYELLKELAYDDSPWTDEDMDLLAEEAGEMLDKFSTHVS